MSSLKSNYTYSLINTVTKILFPIITFPYVARVLMPEGIGQVNFFQSIIEYITFFASLGIPIYAVREIARRKDDEKVMNRTAMEILLFNGLLTIVGYLAVLVISLTVPEVKENLPLFLVLSASVLFTLIGSEWFFQGVEDFKYITIRGLIVKIVAIAFLFATVKTRDDLIYYGVYLVVGVVGGNIFNLFYLRKYIKRRFIEIRELRPMKHLSPSIRIFMISVITSIYLQLDTIMLGFMQGNESVGYYTGAMKLTKLLLGVTSSLCVVLLPRLSALAKNSDTDEFNRISGKSFDFVITISLPLVVGLIAMAPTLIYLFCGEEYVPSISCMQIAAPIILFISVSYVFAQLMYAIGKENVTIIMGVCGAVINLCVNLLLIPQYAQNGASFATLLAELGVMLAYVIVGRRYFKIDIFKRRNLSPLVAVAVMGAVIVPLQFAEMPHLVNLFVTPLVGAVAYGTVLWKMRDTMFLEMIAIVLQKIKRK